MCQTWQTFANKASKILQTKHDRRGTCHVSSRQQCHCLHPGVHATKWESVRERESERELKRELNSCKQINITLHRFACYAYTYARSAGWLAGCVYSWPKSFPIRGRPGRRPRSMVERWSNLLRFACVVVDAAVAGLQWIETVWCLFRPMQSSTHAGMTRPGRAHNIRVCCPCVCVCWPSAPREKWFSQDHARSFFFC